MTIQQRIILFFILITALLLSVIALMGYRLSLQQELTQAQKNRYESYRLAVQLKNTADELTQMARTYTHTGDPRYLEYYRHILAIREGKEIRPKGYDILFWDKISPEKDFIPPKTGTKISFQALLKRYNISSQERAVLHQAKKYADKLTELERQAFHLMNLASQDDSLSGVNRLTAQQLLYGTQYLRDKAKMMQKLSDYFSLIDRRTSAKVQSIAQRTRQIDFTIFSLILLLLFLALYSWFHSRRKIVHPLRELIDWTKKLKKGSFEFEGTIQGEDEIGQLARSFTHMADTIHQSLNDLNVKAHTDCLTGLPNRMALEIEMQRLHLAVKYYGIHCNVVLVDLDHFKTINDRYGHELGDKVLIHFARLLREHIQAPQFAGRWGGEEFLILTKELTCTQTKGLVESLRRGVEQDTFPGGIHVTFSAGISPIEVDESIDAALRRADAALYRAKRLGRNRVETQEQDAP
ncbi:diguanylate cyclase [Nitratifractor sp.]